MLAINEKYFEKFRKNIIGIDQTFVSPYGIQKLIYADWIASGRLYGPMSKPFRRSLALLLLATPILRPAKQGYS
jgi:hypothetical protein